MDVIQTICIRQQHTDGWIIAGSIAFAAVCALFLDEPKSQMAEVMPDGTVQLIDVH